MKLGAEVLKGLRCPVDGQLLDQREEGMPEGAVVVTADGRWGYPEEGGFVCLLPERRFEVRPGGADGGERDRG
jgi:hypothetical protein